MDDNELHLWEDHYDPTDKKKRADERKKMNVLAYLQDLTGLLAGIILIFLLLFRVVVVSGDSMNNTLIDGDYILLMNRVFYTEPKQGDIIVASKDSFEDGEPIIKRVIATEGQTVRINDGVVYVDGVALEEEYTATATINNNFEVTVDEGCIFVMGDNRMRSKDSRSSDIGQIDCREVLGKALFLFLPGKNELTKKREFGRIGGLG